MDQLLDELLVKAKKMVKTYHKDQLDLAGAPYLCHLHYVAGQVKHVGTDYEIVAWLHDIVEDTEVTLDALGDMGFPKYILHAIECMTKRKKGIETYEGYLDRVLESPIALVVKLADLEHNRDISRFENPAKIDFDRKTKYDNAIIYLTFKSQS